jgi:hypothetical protein
MKSKYTNIHSFLFYYLFPPLRTTIIRMNSHIESSRPASILIPTRPCSNDTIISPPSSYDVVEELNTSVEEDDVIEDAGNNSKRISCVRGIIEVYSHYIPLTFNYLPESITLVSVSRANLIDWIQMSKEQRSIAMKELYLPVEVYHRIPVSTINVSLGYSFQYFEKLYEMNHESGNQSEFIRQINELLPPRFLALLEPESINRNGKRIMYKFSLKNPENNRMILTLPGGKIYDSEHSLRSGESLEEILLDEVEEETGILRRYLSDEVKHIFIDDQCKYETYYYSMRLNLPFPEKELWTIRNNLCKEFIKTHRHGLIHFTHLKTNEWSILKQKWKTIIQSYQ